LHRSSAVEVPPSGSGRFIGGDVLWVVSRRLCRFASLALPALSRRQRISAVQLHLREASPFAATDAYAVIATDRAAIWFWDAAEVARAAEQCGVALARLWVVPESAMMAPAPADGVRVIECLEGFEAQCYKGGQLAASHWWPARPNDSDWSMFVRQLGANAEGLPDRAPPLQSVARSAVPSVANDLPTRRGAGGPDLERVLYAAGAAALIAWASWLGGGWLKLEFESRQAAAQIEQQQQAAAPAARAREAALEDAQYVQAIAGYARYPDPRLVLAALARALPGDGITVNEIDIKDGALRAQLTAGAANPPIAEFVKALNDSRVLANAKANTEVGGRIVTLTADIRPRGDGG
jgi:hypothetical protein